MAQLTWHRWVRKAAEFANWAVGPLNIGLAALLTPSQTQLSNWPGWARETITWTQQNAVTLILGTSGVLIAAKVILRLTRDPAQLAAVKKVLDVFRGLVFQNVDGDPRHHHRVTLFRHNGRYLVQYCRSDHTTQKSKTKWFAPDDADRAEGIAGHVWSADSILTVTDLPDISCAVAPLTHVADYARRTYVSSEWAQRHRPKARSYVGIPVRVGGRLWGVVVLDSRGTNTIRQVGEDREPYVMMARIISGVLWEN